MFVFYFPANFLVISYNCFRFSWSDASSASLARYSMTFSLSVFTLFLSALFASVYSSCCVVLLLSFGCCQWHLSFPSSIALSCQYLQKSSLFVGISSFPQLRCMFCPHLIDLLPLCVYVLVSFFRNIL